MENRRVFFQFHAHRKTVECETKINQKNKKKKKIEGLIEREKKKIACSNQAVLTFEGLPKHCVSQCATEAFVVVHT